MAKAKKNYVTMGCNDCKNRNYYINKSRGKTQQPVKLELNKYCRYCKKHTLHKETK